MINMFYLNHKQTQIFQQKLSINRIPSLKKQLLLLKHFKIKINYLETSLLLCKKDKIDGSATASFSLYKMFKCTVNALYF